MAAPAPLSPLAPKTYPALPPIAGVRFATIAAGVRYAGRTDVMMALFDGPAAVAGVFTRSKCPSAPVDWCRAHLAGGQARALIVNSGNANAFTGGVGAAAVAHVAEAAAKAIGANPSEIFMASTGVIGEPLDGTRIARVIDALVADAKRRRASRRRQGDHDDRHLSEDRDRARQARRRRGRDQRHRQGRGHDRARHGDHAGLRLHRRAVAPGALQAMLSKSVERSFNAITVDSDTSTSDTLMIFATGAAQGAPRIEDAADPRAAAFRRALDKLLRNLAHQVVRDGEGARKFITVNVEGAASRKAAKRIAFSIANSPLVKTACAGEDANWGRVVMAVGKAGEKAERDKLDIFFGKIRVAHDGLRDPDYDEAAASAYMKRDAIEITADLDLGRGRATVWTCDLTKEYVAINGDYRS